MIENGASIRPVDGKGFVWKNDQSVYTTTKQINNAKFCDNLFKDTLSCADEWKNLNIIQDDIDWELIEKRFKSLVKKHGISIIKFDEIMANNPDIKFSDTFVGNIKEFIYPIAYDLNCKFSSVMDNFFVTGLPSIELYFRNHVVQRSTSAEMQEKINFYIDHGNFSKLGKEILKKEKTFSEDYTLKDFEIEIYNANLEIFTSFDSSSGLVA